MIDIDRIRENFDEVKRNLERRDDFPIDTLEEVRDVDERWRECKQKADRLRSKRNNITDNIEEKKRSGKDAENLIKVAGNVKQQIENTSAQESELKEKRDELLMRIPQEPLDDVPDGESEADNVERRREGFDDQRDLPDEIIPHYELAVDQRWLDEENAAKVSGSGYYFLKGDLARLEHGLIQFMMDIHREQGYKDIFPPIPVRSESMEGTGQLPKFDVDSYKIEDEDLWLCPTAEVPVTNMHREDILVNGDIPIKYQAYTPNFRREAGEHGTETRGIARVHQFNKVELVNFVAPEDSYDQFWTLLDEAEEVLRRLEIPYRTLEMCTGDLGFKASRQIDIEVWAPGTTVDDGPDLGGRWLEVSTVSNFESFQARRMNTRYREKAHKDTSYPHTLNGSGLALPRVVISILEYYQNEDGTVSVPEAVQPYCGGMEKLTPEE